ncbi:MAG: hypothetical protein GWN37_10700, partial [Gammaproteobacteria bacterium]|nr:hypothetical protein [Gammaproteobacteria bacterium]
WATAAPFYSAAVVLVLVYMGVWQPWCPPEASAAGEAVAAPFACASIALIAYTIGSHRVPLALWHQ